MLIKGHESSYYTSWGSSYFESTGNLPWSMNGPGEPPTSGPAPDAVSVDAGTNAMLTPIPPYEAQLWQLDGGADIVVVKLVHRLRASSRQRLRTGSELGNSGGSPSA